MKNWRQTKITDLPSTMRPREKLFTQGVQNLSNVELLAILLGSGTRKYNALGLAEKLLKKYELSSLLKSSSLSQPLISGLGRTKFARVLAALELGFRLFGPKEPHKIRISSTIQALEQVKDLINKKQEWMVALYLNARHELLKKEVVGIGSLNILMIEPKEIFSHALQTPCAAIILAHNHPSGDSNPSNEDIRFTEQIQQAGEILGVTVLDHLIISHSAYYSFRQNSLNPLP